MKVKNLLGKLSIIALMAVAAQSCKKENGIDNNNVIQRPYALYVSDSTGNIYKTNDGNNYKTIFPGDGNPLRAITTSKQNLVFVKGMTVFLSTNEGKTFNPIKQTLVQVPSGIRWQNFILDIPQLNRLYISNTLGIIGKISQSPQNGVYFELDTSYTEVDTPYLVESFAFTNNQILYGYSSSGSKFGVSKFFYKAGKDAKWKPMVTDLPSPHSFYLTAWGNKIVATDYDGVKGALHSSDTGKTFVAFTGLPSAKLLSTYSAHDKLLVGTQGNGIYLYDGATFVPSNSGIDAKTSVYGIVAKDNYYKNKATKKFFYIATNTGIYKSEDLAKSWIKVKTGDYRLIN
jgi:hypothetical protein